MPRRGSTGPGRARRRRWLVAAVVVVVLLAGGGVLAWRLTRTPSTTAARRTVTVSRQDVQETVGTTGTVEPARRADLSFATSGTVTSVKVAVGDKVAKGDVLATLDDDDLQADLEAARADRDAAEDDLSTAEDDSGTTSAELAAAKAKVAVDTNAVAQAEDGLADAKLRATFAGTVATVSVTKGDTVGSSGGSGGSGGSGATTTTASSAGSDAAVTVISTDRYTVAASVGSADLAKIKKGLQAQITTAGSTGTVFGTVDTVAVMASSSSSTGTTSGSAATFDVSIDVTGSRRDLYAGATATVSIIVAERSDVLTVPTLAVSSANGQPVVTRLVGTAEVATPVTLGASYGATTEVTKGLTAGDQVVITLPGRAAAAGGNASARNRSGYGGYGGYSGTGGTGGTGGGEPPAGGQNGTGQNGTGQNGAGQNGAGNR